MNFKRLVNSKTLFAYIHRHEMLFRIFVSAYIWSYSWTEFLDLTKIEKLLSSRSSSFANRQILLKIWWHSENRIAFKEIDWL